MTRRELREEIFKLLFLVEFHEENELDEQERLYFEEMEWLEEKDRTYIQSKYQHIHEIVTSLDEDIINVAKGWKMERMGKVELTIMRLAVYEMKYDEEIPTGVAINEAVELAKKYGGEESSAFVNGILAKLA